MKHSQTDEWRTACAEQAQAFALKIPASEKARFLDSAQDARDGVRGFSSAALAWDIREIALMYPWPSSEALRAAGEARWKRMGGVNASDATGGLDLIRQMLEEPDALLG